MNILIYYGINCNLNVHVDSCILVSVSSFVDTLNNKLDEW